MLEMLPDQKHRAMCASALNRLNAGKTVTQHFLQIGWRELKSENPDRHWLEAVIEGVGHYDDPRVADLLVTIFERVDLPGWVRGDAGDKIGSVQGVLDRRTRLFHRCRDAALRGLSDDSIEVRFWSMYVIGSLASGTVARRRRPLSARDARLGGLAAALPRLREIAANDHRLAPGYWWPMSAEAEDVIDCLETGQWRDPDAGERWLGNNERGVWQRD